MRREELARFNRIMQGIEKFYEDYAKSVGLSYMSLTVLEIIYYASNPITQKEICAESHYIKQMVNTIVKNFYEAGYVEFAEAEEDRRNKYVTLTVDGREYADKILKPLENMEEKAIATLSDTERKQMLEMLERCFDGYGKNSSLFRHKPFV